MERIPSARRIRTKKEQMIKIEKMSVEDEDLREEGRGNSLDLDAILVQIVEETLDWICYLPETKKEEVLCDKERKI
ncbi:hypothetical protein Hanom_Chr09g00818431 [Helianthus anomalus]